MEKNTKQEIVSYLTKTSEHTFIKLGWAVSCSHRSGIWFVGLGSIFVEISHFASAVILTFGLFRLKDLVILTAKPTELT